MQIKKKEINKVLTLFLALHLFIWVAIPAVTNNNLPLDTIEALAWGSDLNWGYNKHPPLSAFFVEVFYQIFKSQDWVYYLLSQIFIVFTFFIIFKFSQDFLKDPIHSLISVLLLEGIFFYNFTTPEFNVNVCQIPFWALSVLFCWRGLKNNQFIDWVLLGFFAALGVLSKYLFFYLLVALALFLIFSFLKKKNNYKFLISIPVFLLVLLPHFIWLSENNYVTITYALNRTGIEDYIFLNHFIYPLIFLGKQFVILIPFFLMFLFLISKFKIKVNFKDKKLLFLLFINIFPIILIFLTSMLMGAKIRTMWMTPFYIFFGVLFVYIFQSKLNMKKLKNFTIIFSIMFILSPVTYSYVSISQKDKRTDYNGKEIAEKVQKKWNNKHKNEIMFVSGNEWIAGNLSYHLKSRPKWIMSGNFFSIYKIEDDKLKIKDNVIKLVENNFILFGYK